MQKTPTNFAAFIGIDWTDRKHDLGLHVPGGAKRERSVLEHRPAAIAAWADALRERFGGTPQRRRRRVRARGHAHDVWYPDAIDRRAAAIRAEQPLTTDVAVIGPARLLVEALVPQLRAVCQAIARYDDEIDRLCARLADYRLFRALPGAGPVFAARLLAAFGERRERFPRPPRCSATPASRP
jgi:hypothetical protein